MSRWTRRRIKTDYEKAAKALGVSPACACVLANRGILSNSEALSFLNCDIKSVASCSGMKDAGKASEIILNAIKNGSLIGIYGDYDADGVMSTVILYKAIKRLGGSAVYYVPDRVSEGYGLNTEAIGRLLREGVSVLLTCDNGIAAANEIAFAKSRGMQTVVIDHHEPPFLLEDGIKRELLPPADAVIDPKQKDCTYGFSDFCAAGLSYKFAKGLFEESQKSFDETGELLTYAAIATICDIVSLTGENRAIAKCGIENIKNTGNPGLNALILESGLKDKNITEYHVGFVIGPAINATGRLESAELAVSLFIDSDEESCAEKAARLSEMNRERKSITLRSYEKAIDIIKEEGYESHKVITVYSGEISESIAGIVAGRVRETFNRPAVVITASGETVKGSARSIEGYNVFDALLAHSDMFVKFGGHAMAAGFSMDRGSVDSLREALNIECALSHEDFLPVYSIDCELKPEHASYGFAKEMERLSPFGKGNPEPLFGIKNLTVNGIRFLGADKRAVRLDFFGGSSKTALRGLYFGGMESFLKKISEGYGDDVCDKIALGTVPRLDMDIVFNIGINEFRGEESVQLIIRDFRRSK